MDWEQHKYGKGVECTFTPRKEYKGRAMLPGMDERAGETVRLIALWLMNEDDPYPGEWALGAEDRCSDVFGRSWIASGDVTPKEGPACSPLRKALAAGEDTSGLCTVRDMAALMIEQKTDVCELYFRHEGKEWNVEMRILRADDEAIDTSPK